jgi:hypothetical protein
MWQYGTNPWGEMGLFFSYLFSYKRHKYAHLLRLLRPPPRKIYVPIFQCPQPTQILVDTEHNSLQYKHDVSSLSPKVELHCRDTLDSFVDIRKSFVLDVLFIVGTTRSKYGSCSTARPSVTQQRGALRLHSTAAQFS